MPQATVEPSDTKEEKGVLVDVDGTPGQHILEKITRNEASDVVDRILDERLRDQMNDAKSDIHKSPDHMAAFSARQIVDELIRQTASPKSQIKRSNEMLGGVFRCIGRAKGDPIRAFDIAKKLYGPEHAVSKALSSGIGEEGAFVIRDETSAEIIELLLAMSAFRKSNPTIIQMDAATFTMPKLTAGSTATYIGENTNIPISQPKFGQVRLVFKKLAVLVPISNDFLRYQSAGADAMVREDMSNQIALRADLAFIRDDGTQDTPTGMLFQVVASQIINAQASTTLDKTTQDLGKMVQALLDANTRLIRPGWIFAPRTWVYLATVRDANGNFAFREELLQGKLWTWPVQLTTQIPINLGGGSDSEIYLADFADMVVGESTSLILDASSDAAYSDGANIQAAFSLDQTVMRAIVEHDMVVRHDTSIVVLDKVDWAA